jgi:hypothetical protein
MVARAETMRGDWLQIPGRLHVSIHE